MSGRGGGSGGGGGGGSRRWHGKGHNKDPAQPKFVPKQQPDAKALEEAAKRKQLEEEAAAAEAAKRAAEEDAKRQAEEAERKKREEEERLRREEEEKQRQEELKRRQQFQALRTANLNAAATRPDSSYFKSLDSSIKKNTAFVKKLATKLTDETRDALIKELKTLNLNRYITELAQAVATVPLKTTDVDAAVKVCSQIHQLYADFTPQLIPALVKSLQAEKEDNLVRRRVLMRLIAELLLYGLYTDETVLFGALKDLLTAKEKAVQILTLVLSFVRSVGHDLLGIVPRGLKPTESPAAVPFSTDDNGDSSGAKLVTERRQATDDDIFGGIESTPGASADVNAPVQAPPQALYELVMLPEKRQPFVTLLDKFFDKLTTFVMKEHQQLVQVEKHNRDLLMTKGELSTNAQEEYEKTRNAFFKLHQNFIQLAELMDKDVPELPEEEKTSRVPDATPLSRESAGLAALEAANLEDKDTGVWDDEDQKNLYENIPDLKERVPAILLGLGDEKDTTKKKDGEAESTTADPVAPTSPRGSADTAAPTPAATTATPSTASTEIAEETNTAAADKITLFLQHLNKCVNRDMIDAAAVEFCYIMSKANRQRVVKHMFTVPRTRLEALPYYARFIAIMNPFFKDMGKDLCTRLEDEFKQLFQEKDQINIETKIKNIRFLSELVKFKVCPTNTIFTFLKMCLDDFKHHNVDVACALLETCGRYLYRTPETHIRTQTLLDIMMQVKNSKHFTARYELMVENAFFACKPPVAAGPRGKQRPPMHLYIRKLVWDDSTKEHSKAALRQLRALNWSADGAYVLKCFTKIHKGKFNNISIIASLAAALALYHEDFAIMLVDSILEKIRFMLEAHDYRYQQHLVMYIKYLGELYIWQLVDHRVIFETLYTLIAFGHHLKGQFSPSEASEITAAIATNTHSASTASLSSPTSASTATTPIPTSSIPTDISEINPLDLPDESFRARLVCVLLDACGQYFKKGGTKDKLDRFLIYFQRYILSKRHLSRDMIFTIDDLFIGLRPRMRRFKTYEEAVLAISQLEDLQRQRNPKYIPVDILFSAPYLVKRFDTKDDNNDSDQKNEDNDDKEFADNFTEKEVEQSGEAQDDDMDDGANDNDEGQHDDESNTEDEDDEFAKELELMIAENREARKTDSSYQQAIKNNAIGSIPTGLIRKKVASASAAASTSSSVDSSAGSDAGDSDASDNQHQQQQQRPAMMFQLLTKKGSKPQAVAVDIPVESKLVQHVLQARDEEREEQRRMKALTLKFDQMDREEQRKAQEQIAVGQKPYLQTQRGQQNPNYKPDQQQQQQAQTMDVYKAANLALKGEDIPQFSSKAPRMAPKKPGEHYSIKKR